jgi:type I restriction enzyme S subunit
MSDTVILSNFEWREVTIGNVCSNVVTGGTPLTKVKEYYVDGKIPWLKTKEVNFSFIKETEYYITELGLKKSSAKLIPKNSVVVAMYGQGDTAGRVAVNKIPLATNQACCNLVIDESISTYMFIYYYLKKSYEELVQRKTGSAQPNLNTKLIKSFGISLPPLPEQKAIAEVLSSLDDKIDLLHRQNKTH